MSYILLVIVFHGIGFIGIEKELGDKASEDDLNGEGC
jgi:hypothetical protein